MVRDSAFRVLDPESCKLFSGSEVIGKKRPAVEEGLKAGGPEGRLGHSP